MRHWLAFTVIFSIAAAVLDADVIDRGVQTESGDTGGVTREIDINPGPILYQLLISLTPEKEGARRIRSISLRGGRTGSAHASKRGWGTGFLEVTLGDVSLCAFPCRIEVSPEEARLVFETPQGEAVLRFLAERQREWICCEVKGPPAGAPISVRFTAHPGDFLKTVGAGKTERWFATATRHVRQSEKGDPKAAGMVALDTERESWIYFYDAKINPVSNAARANCALLYHPGEVDAVEIGASPAVIQTTLRGKPGIPSLHVLLWDFPGEDTEQCLRYMKSLSVTFRPPAATTERQR